VGVGVEKVNYNQYQHLKLNFTAPLASLACCWRERKKVFLPLLTQRSLGYLPSVRAVGGYRDEPAVGPGVGCR